MQRDAAAAIALLLLATATCWAAPTPGSTSIEDDAEPTILPAGSTAINLIADGPLTLSPNDFRIDDKECSSRQVLRAKYDGFALPDATPTISILMALTAASCQGTGGQPGVLFGLPDVDVSLDCATSAIVLASTAGLGSIRYKAPLHSIPTEVTVVLSRDQRSWCSLCEPSVTMCINGQLAAPDASSPLMAALKANNRTLLTGGLTIGAGSDADRSANATISQLWLTTGAVIPCSAVTKGLAGLPGIPAPSNSPLGAVPIMIQELKSLEAANSQPIIDTISQTPSGDVFVGDSVRFDVVATDKDGDDLRLVLTFFGLAPTGCSASECGDWREKVFSTGGSGNLTAVVSYPRPGRYVVRVQVSDMRGSIMTTDHAILVRKQGDTERRAPCCRQSSYVVGQQLGRPIHETQFRPHSLGALANNLGWGKNYMQNEDLEAERLFDFGVLAPLETAPLKTTTCQDTRLAGAGSPIVYGSTDATRAETQGHSKKLVIVPQALPWASASQVACQKHSMTKWEEKSPYAVVSRTGEVCSVGCTRNATEMLIRTTGMFSQYNEALMASSYGQLSLNTDVLVLPEVIVPKDVPYDDLPYAYYERPAIQALDQVGVTPWIYVVLSPLANHQVPPFRAWSGGMGAKNAIVTQCYPTLYYSVHESGHRMGFRHANIYRLDKAISAPSDPLGPGQLTTTGYSSVLDGMAGPRGDFGLYNRIMAGWVPGSSRKLINPQDLTQEGSQRLVLWPFDRSESRGNLMSLIVRRSADEILVIGYRSTPHWQDVHVAPGGMVAPEDMRSNVAGLSVELVRRNPATGVWSESGLLDFNILHGDWPHALPDKDGAFPRMSHFALMKPGYSWYDPASKMLLSFERAGLCGQGVPGGPVWNYTVPNFYGFRGEFSGYESPERADYSGFASLECANLVLRTGAAPPSGRLEFSLDASLDDPCTLKPTFAVRSSAPLASVIWKNSLNQTLASGPATFTLPHAQSQQTYHVHVLAEDGRHTHAVLALQSISPTGVQYSIQFKFFELDTLSFESESKTAPFAPVVCEQPAPSPSPPANPPTIIPIPMPTETKSSSSGGIPIAALAGAGAGIGVLLAALVVLCICLRRRARRLEAAAAQLPKGAHVKVEVPEGA